MPWAQHSFSASRSFDAFNTRPWARGYCCHIVETVSGLLLIDLYSAICYRSAFPAANKNEQENIVRQIDTPPRLIDFHVTLDVTTYGSPQPELMKCVTIVGSQHFNFDAGDINP